MAVYYINPHNGNNALDGLTPETAVLDEKKLNIQPGDKVLFRRGSFVRGFIDPVEGTKDAPVTYGAYGEGEKPTFCGSVDVSGPENWEKVSQNIWRCTKEVSSDAGNFVFNEDECTATLRWSKEELSGQGDFFDNRYGQIKLKQPVSDQELLMYSEGNPGSYYRHIECVPYGNRRLCTLKSHMIIEDLAFINSGVHAMRGAGEHITIRRCDFRNIGGCVWSPELKIRFGNGIELWNIGNYVLVEDCYFLNTYDSCVTHQGRGEKMKPAVRFDCRRNVFDTYGMAAFEYRDELPLGSDFTDNICRNAGCGFAMLGEGNPRSSEIWPQPMGHHIFLWRIEGVHEGANVLIARNEFGPAPVGAAIYSIICPEAEAKMELRENTYTANPVLLNRFGGKNYNDFELYRKETGKDQGSRIHA